MTTPWGEYFTILLQWVIIPIIVAMMLIGGALEIIEGYKKEKKEKKD